MSGQRGPCPPRRVAYRARPSSRRGCVRRRAGRRSSHRPADMMRSTGSGATENAPASMRVMSSRPEMRSRIRSACRSIILKNCRLSAASNGTDAPSTLAAVPFDGGQRRAQFVAHHAQKLTSRPFQLLDGRQVLYDGDRGLYLPVFGVDGRCVDENDDGLSVRADEQDLLCARGLTAVQHSGQRTLLGSVLAPVHTPVEGDLVIAVEAAAQRVRHTDDALDLVVDQMTSRVCASMTNIPTARP